MKLLRDNLPNIWRAIDLVHARHGSIIQIAGNVICRQRPGTAKGFVFISLEDETGVSNAIVEPELFERFRLADHRGSLSAHRRRSAEFGQRRFDQNARNQTARARTAHRKRVARFPLIVAASLLKRPRLSCYIAALSDSATATAIRPRDAARASFGWAGFSPGFSSVWAQSV